MFFKTAGQIGGDAGIESVVGTEEDVEEVHEGIIE